MDSKTNFLTLPLDRICGIRPEAWLVVGAGFAREDVKALLLKQGRGFVGNAVTGLQELCANLTSTPSDRFLSPTGRQEILRHLLFEPRIEGELKELQKLRRQKDFFRRLDTALQSGRMAFAHSEEEEVYSERLAQNFGTSRLRQELSALSKAYEAWLEASSWVDLPLLLKQALLRLRNQGWPEQFSRPEEIFFLSIQNPESLEKEFWETLGQFVKVSQLKSLFSRESTDAGDISTGIEWERWHTLDEAAEALADELSSRSAVGEWDDDAILIPDHPAVRRSLRRALELRGLPPAEPRDPTRLLWDEAVKWAFLPLEVVARNFQRQTVISWLRIFGAAGPELAEGVNEINARGIRTGISFYAGGKLEPVHAKLETLLNSLGGRKTCKELSECHLKVLEGCQPPESHLSSHFWVIRFVKAFWESLAQDFERIGQGERKAPTLFWYEKLQSRLRDSAPPVDGMKPQHGIRIYRLQQSPILPVSRLWVLGLPSNWLNGEGTGSYWFSDREREILSEEFAVRSSLQVRQERVELLKSWIAASNQCTVLDAHYDTEGRERESLLPILTEIAPSFGSPIEKGAHPRFSRSYRTFFPVQPVTVKLAPLPRRETGGAPVISATTLDRYSRCSFQALAYHRWKLKDLRDPGAELWPEVKGQLLHEAVKFLLESHRGGVQFELTPDEALDKAWKRTYPKGLIQSERIRNHIRSRLREVVRIFFEKEKEYLKKSGSRHFSLDEMQLQLEYPDFSIVGKPDRIDTWNGEAQDEALDGFFVMDYKSSGTLPHGAEMIEQGYRLQLPFYALALMRKTGRSVLGTQFIELDRQGGRKSGIFFKQFNGKDPGCLTEVRSNSKSLVALSLDETWSLLEEKIVTSATGFIEGNFEARPNVTQRLKECSRCRVQDVCGFKRQGHAEVETV